MDSPSARVGRRFSIPIIVVVLVAVYVYLSFDVLDPTQAGLDFNRITYQLGRATSAADSKARVYTRGRHWLGLGHHFIKFPLTNELIEFSGSGELRSRTSDGLEVLLEVSLQYKLVNASIPDLYTKFGPNYVAALQLFTMDAINSKATSYTAGTFFSQRTVVQQGFETKLREVFLAEGYAIIPAGRFQLRTVSLPDLFEDALQNTEVMKQDIERALAEKSFQQVAGATTFLVAEQRSLVTIQTAEADAKTIELNVDAHVAAFDISQGLASTEFAQVKFALQENETSLLEYQKVRALFSHPDTHTIVNIKLPGHAAPMMTK